MQGLFFGTALFACHFPKEARGSEDIEIWRVYS